MKRLWLMFGFIFLASFAVLLWVGTEIFREAAPIPAKVVTTDGKTLATADDISSGQNVWQAMGGMQVGSIWGHGSYVAPDWTADYLHHEAMFIADKLAEKEFSATFEKLDAEKQAVIKSRLKTMLRTNTYDASSGVLTVDPMRMEAFREILAKNSKTFTDGNADYAIQKGAQSDPERLRKLNTFFFWTAWASAADRPGKAISYTSNFPAEPMVDNVPTADTIVWTGVSVIALIAGIGMMVWYFAGLRQETPTDDAPNSDPLIGFQPTPSQKATTKYFLIVTLLFLLQIILGVITAHYGVEGMGFYGIPLADILPYVVTRTWHVQLGIFWIATAWLAPDYLSDRLSADTNPSIKTRC
ncbi:MAG: hypothetical protein R2684_12025 [Pyrinomonadaceae bacterium]